MKIIDKKDNQITFQTEIDESLANAIRRYLNHIPILAIDETEISKNDSPLYDETVSHRLGLVPLKMDKAVNDKTETKLKLSSKKEGYIYSEELKGSIKVAYDKIPITTLSKNQELEIIAFVKSGKGYEHSKFSPGLMYYRNVSEITMPKGFLNEVKRIFPNNEVKEKGDKIVIINDKKNDISDGCEGICEEVGKKAEIDVKKDLIIVLESFGQLEVKDILKKSIETLKKDLAEVSKKVK